MYHRFVWISISLQHLAAHIVYIATEGKGVKAVSTGNYIFITPGGGDGGVCVCDGGMWHH